jgi:hypothetical protein
MQIQVNTDHHLQGSEARDVWARGVVQAAVEHLAGQVTRVEVHLGEEHAGRGADDHRCVMEARLTGRPPVAVTHHAESLDAAVNGAAGKLVRAMEHSLGRATQHAREPRPAIDGAVEAPVSLAG